jgi:hypothetical protein
MVYYYLQEHILQVENAKDELRKTNQLDLCWILTGFVRGYAQIDV